MNKKTLTEADIRTKFITPALDVEREIPLDQFPGPEELWQRYRKSRGYTYEQAAVTTCDYAIQKSIGLPKSFSFVRGVQIQIRSGSPYRILPE